MTLWLLVRQSLLSYSVRNEHRHLSLPSLACVHGGPTWYFLGGDLVLTSSAISLNSSLTRTLSSFQFIESVYLPLDFFTGLCLMLLFLIVFGESSIELVKKIGIGPHQSIVTEVVPSCRKFASHARVEVMTSRYHKCRLIKPLAA